MENTKIYTWDGPNKARVREIKTDLIRRLELKQLKFLTLPGACAHFEKALIDEGLAVHSNIIGVQHNKKKFNHDGSEVLSFLEENTRDVGHIPMFIGDLSEFGEVHHSLLYNSKAEFMKTLLKKKMYPFDSGGKHFPSSFFYGTKCNFKLDVLDIDLCGSFGEESVTSVTKLFSNNILGPRGLLFINHQKGREIQENVSSFLEREIDVAKTVDRKYNYLTSVESTGDEFRYRTIPLVYLRRALLSRVSLYLEKVLEYRDKNGKLNAPNMIQYCFYFETQTEFNSKLVYSQNNRKLSDLGREVVECGGSKDYSGSIFRKMLD